MKTWKCTYCTLEVHEMGAYVKMTATMRAHLECYKQALEISTRSLVRLEALQATADDAERQRIQAENAWRAAPRCPKCGVPMLSERPKSLPDAFSTVLTSNGTTCTLCVRQEAGLRAAARGREAPVPVRVAPSPERPEERNAVQSQDAELMRKAKEAGTPAIEIE